MASDISYSLVDLSSKKVMANKNQNSPMVLASVSKIFSSFYVLNHLDPKKTISTQIYASKNAKIEKNNLIGDLIIQGNGNPFMTAQNLIDLIYQIKAKGIEKVSGRFIIHINDFWSTSRLSKLGLEDQADNTAMGPFNVEFNRFSVERSSNLTLPNMKYLRITEKKLNAPGLKYKSIKDGDHEHWQKNINEKHGFFEDLPVKDSLLFSGSFFHNLASQHGLILNKPEVAQDIETGQLLARQESLPIYRLVELGIEYSNNLIAEMLLQQVHSEAPAKAAQKMLNWYKEKYKDDDLDWNNTTLINASGITLQNKTTARHLALLLTDMYHADLKRNFLSYLSINGHSGGIRKRLKSAKYSYQVFAKTGSLFYVNNLAGYLRAKSGKLYAFSIFTTDNKKRDLLNKPNSKEINKIRQNAKAWYYKSTQEIDTILSNFIDQY